MGQNTEITTSNRGVFKTYSSVYDKAFCKNS